MLPSLRKADQADVLHSVKPTNILFHVKFVHTFVWKLFFKQMNLPSERKTNRHGHPPRQWLLNVQRLVIRLKANILLVLDSPHDRMICLKTANKWSYFSSYPIVFNYLVIIIRHGWSCPLEASGLNKLVTSLSMTSTMIMSPLKLNVTSMLLEGIMFRVQTLPYKELPTVR